MPRILKSFALSAALIFSMASAANARGLKSTIKAPLATPVKIEISLSDDLAYRADHLPKNLSKRGSNFGANSGFSQNGFYGEKDLARLEERLGNKLIKQFEKRGLIVSDTAPTILRVTLTDVRNNRPTFAQISEAPSLSLNSFGTGGAEMDAELISADGTSLGTIYYNYFETDIRDSQFGGFWTDANRAIDQFAKNTAKHLAKGS